MADEPIANDGAVVPTARQPERFDDDDRIEWAISKGDAPLKRGRGELHFRNLTRNEMVQFLMTLDKLQTDRKLATLAAGGMVKPEPETAAEQYAREQNIPLAQVHDYLAYHGQPVEREAALAGELVKEGHSMADAEKMAAEASK